MIQSRPQFGYVGALLVWAFAYLQSAGFNIFNTILAGDALHSTIGGPSKMWIVMATFVRGSKWNLMPIPGILAALQLYADRPFEERWGKAAHALSRHGGKLLGWYANIDDLPEESNYVGLDFNLPDSDGLPAARVHYQLSQNSLRSMDFAGERMTEAHLTAGAVDVFTTRRMPSGHILGTARMGSDPATSVVDEYGRSHDVPNLVIVDGRVMVTGSGMNPTATITALALRAAEHLADAAANLPAQH